MNISAVSCSPIKPKASFGQVEDKTNYEQVTKVTEAMNDELVQSKNIKKPLAAALSIGLAVALAYASGKRIAGIVSHIFKKAPETLESFFKKGAQLTEGLAGKLKTVNPDKKIVGEGSKLAGKKLGNLLNKVKIGKIENTVGSLLEKAEGTAKKVYKKIAYAGLQEGGNKAAKAMENIFGWGAVGTVVPTVLKKDANEDGVSDILQRGQNAYTGTQSKFAGAIDKANGLADLVDLLT